jgi:hypothetical protein
MTKAQAVLVAVIITLSVSFGIHQINPFPALSTSKNISVVKPDSALAKTSMDIRLRFSGS